MTVANTIVIYSFGCPLLQNPADFPKPIFIRKGSCQNPLAIDNKCQVGDGRLPEMKTELPPSLVKKTK